MVVPWMPKWHNTTCDYGKRDGLLSPGLARQWCVTKRGCRDAQFISSPRRRSRDTTPPLRRCRHAAEFRAAIPPPAKPKRPAVCAVFRPVSLDPNEFRRCSPPLGDHIGDLTDGVVDAGTHVDVVWSVEVFQKVQTRTGQIIDMQQLTPWSSGAPVGHLRRAAGSGLFIPADERWQQMRA